MARLVGINERDLMKLATLSVEVRVKRDWRVVAGLWLIRLGAWFCGVNYEEAANG